ncbi:MAG TPA: methyltransferase domain-containing protein [Bacteriovoracaceae bacterium]|nr:methyltransferase domain-containing protein [Bacteriovoracaceae bacterium]
MKYLLLLLVSFSSFAREPIGPNRYQQLTGIKKNPLAELNNRSHSKGPDQFLVENLSYLPTGGDVLDINSKEGRSALFLASKGYKVTSIQPPSQRSKWPTDSMATGVNWAWTTLKEQWSTKLSYDVIMCFEHLTPKELDKLKSWLKPGGVLIYETPNLRHPDAKSNPADFSKSSDLLALVGKGYTLLKFEDPPFSKEFRSGIILRKD